MLARAGVPMRCARMSRSQRAGHGCGCGPAHEARAQGAAAAREAAPATRVDANTSTGESLEGMVPLARGAFMMGSDSDGSASHGPEDTTGNVGFRCAR